jgi:Holliday junction resolvase
MSKPRYAVIKDHNHDSLVADLKKLGCKIIDMAAVGDRFPDLLVLCRRDLLLVEVKNLDTGYGKRGLNKGQREFATWWTTEGGKVYVIRNTDDCIKLVSDDRDSLAFKPTATDLLGLSDGGG